MSSKDYGGYKRIVQYFWDPEPRNDDPLQGPIWCLGRRYDSELSRSHKPTTLKAQEQDACRPQSSKQEITTGQHRSSQQSVANGEDKTLGIPNGRAGEDRGWPPSFLDDFESRIWFTYRSGFPTIRRSDDTTTATSMTFAVRLRSQLVDQGGFSSDTGWGSDWRRATKDREERELLAVFADSPDAPFSIHRFVEHGASACGKHPGEWFGPSATARCIQALVHDHKPSSLKVYINGDGADVYEDKVLSLATAEGQDFNPTLILVGIRLGIDRVTPVYWEALKASLQLPQSIGIAGGRPSSSHYFVGFQGDSFFFLDPHQTRPSVPPRDNATEYTKEDIDSYHTRRLRRLAIQDMDPSMLIGFLIRDEEDWYKWRKSVTEVQGKAVIHVADKEPSIHGLDAECQSAMDDVETFDDEDDSDGELVEHPISEIMTMK
ncbi:MAG: hypothetical protein Q9212_001871 [Teloschistes hypoglaucus]